MRAIRFLALLIVLAVAFIATPTFELRPFASQIPTDFMADSALVAHFRQWVTDDIARSSLILTSWAALTFGLLAVPWPFPGTAVASATVQRTQAVQAAGGRRQLRWWGGLGLVVLATIASVGTVLSLLRIGEGPLAQLLWVGSMLLLLLGGALLAATRPAMSEKRSGAATAFAAVNPVSEPPRPTDSWRTLLVILILSLILYGWKLTTLPPQVDDATAHLGLHALAMTTGAETELLTVVPAISHPEEKLFGVAAASTALFYEITGDLLLSTRLVGLLAAMACALATWLLAVELFARRATFAAGPVPLEDQGQLPTLIATWLVLFNMAVIYFSRQPILLEATAWGILGCWALLRSFRTHDRLTLCLSGLLVGFGYLLHGSALVFGITALLWWLGFMAVQLGMLPHWAPTPSRNRLHFGDFVLWVLGLGVVLAPVAVVRGQELLLWANQLPTSLESALTILLANFAPPVASYPAPLFHGMLLPFFPLALGLLLFNLDRRQGWMLITLLGSALAVAMLTQPQNERWGLLLPLVPAVALTLAFTLDRIRVSLIRVGGQWLQQFIGFALLGLLLWIGSATFIRYDTFAMRLITRDQAISYALRNLPTAQGIVLSPMAFLTLAPETLDQNIALRFLTNDQINQSTRRLQAVET
ncbi:MAG TPA: hypothetical protein P5121_14870, partial [Caldilineaceae bacterium]|nr:hypothetical protein [Caldilineaceae bacterium]